MDAEAQLGCGDGSAPTLADVDALARLVLELRRCGAGVALDAGDPLHALLGLCGLTGLVQPCAAPDGSVVEVERHPEAREDL